MTQTSERVALFIGTDGAESAAAGQFEAVARTFGLFWSALPRTLTAGAGEPLTAADLGRAAVTVAIGRSRVAPGLADRFPDATARVEYWEPDAIEREVMNLVARLLGGRRSDDAASSPAPEPSPPRKSVTVRVGRETAGRRGKGVTTVWDLPLDIAGVRDLAAALKQRCGTGGTVKDGKIEIQGDHRDRITAELEKLGYKVKRSGG
jgi:translation initiation factor 1